MILFNSNGFAVNNCRLLFDQSVRYFTLGFFGKPGSLQGIKTEKIIWGPHTIKNVFTHSLGIFVGGGPLVGFSLLGHPYGEVTIAGNAHGFEVYIENARGGNRYVPYEELQKINDINGTKILVGMQFTKFSELSKEDYKPGDPVKVTYYRPEGLAIGEFRQTGENILKTLFED